MLALFGSDAGQSDAAVAEPVAGALEGDDIGVVDDAVDHGRGDDLVTEHASPARPDSPVLTSVSVQQAQSLRDVGR